MPEQLLFAIEVTLNGLMAGIMYSLVALGFVLIFVGLKMAWLNELFGGKFPISWSLLIIGSILAVSILVSIAWNRVRGPEDKDPT